MDEQLYTIDSQRFQTRCDLDKQNATHALESGHVLYFPQQALSLEPHEQLIFSDTILNKNSKNISYQYMTGHLAGLVTSSETPELTNVVKSLMHRYAEYARQLVGTVLPPYANALRWGRTSYRPSEVKGRVRSKSQDDSRLHVDSFPATPVHGLRILRVFCNINPYGEPRVWHLGEPFPQLIPKFSPNISRYNPLRAQVLHWIKATKTKRSAYDHYMLQLHDRMKLDDEYQQTVNKQRIDFQPSSTWIVFTDQVSHAALSGQFLLEQTFYLPVSAMVTPALSPLRRWEEEKCRALV